MADRASLYYSHSTVSGTAKAKYKPEEQTSFSVWAHDNPQDSTSKISNSTCIGMISAAWPSRYTALPCYLQHHTEGKNLTLNAVWSLYFTPGLFPLFYPIFSHFRRYWKTNVFSFPGKQSITAQEQAFLTMSSVPYMMPHVSYPLHSLHIHMANLKVSKKYHDCICFLPLARHSRYLPLCEKKMLKLAHSLN